MNPSVKLKTIKKCCFFGWLGEGRGEGGGGGGGGLKKVIFFHKESKSNYFFGGELGGGRLGGVGVGEGVNGWTDEQAQPNLPLQLLLSWGHNNALMHK